MAAPRDARRVVVVPPHGDVTLAWPDSPGWSVRDVGGAFLERVLRAEALEAAAAALEAQPAAGAQAPPRAALLLRAAASLLAAPHPHTRLRAAGAALEALSAGSAVRLRLDDLELAEGSTERGADVLAVSAERTPWADDLRRAAPQLAGAAVLRLWIDRDQRLPGALTLLEELGPPGRLQLSGPFSLARRQALAACPPFAGAGFARDGALDAVVAGLPGQRAAGTGPRWQAEPLAAPPPGRRPWAGYVRLGALRDPGALLASGCVTAIVGLCELGERALGPDGATLPRELLARAAERLRAAGARLVAEWWLGAPGVGEDALERTLHTLEQGDAVDWVAGFRLFTWPLGMPASRWPLPVKLAAPDPDHDLARSRPFQAPGTLPAGALAGVLRHLADRVGRLAPLVPGRSAGAYLAGPPPRPAPGPLLRLDADAAVVTAGGRAPGCYAVNLRERTVAGIDPRLGERLRGLREPRPAAVALEPVAAERRQRLVKALVRGRIVVEVER